ncbi:hypothetical protein CDAR_491491 [Caerostris darwini]|uniref:Uncharacterized protein n=1 Tax=Caerostris darwini TaxID=1538125 RepID=A0AAV4X9T5_9ARAC|nr:hypothetical protein CDAR_491491 [Caerostris darwini]
MGGAAIESEGATPISDKKVMSIESEGPTPHFRQKYLRSSPACQEGLLSNSLGFSEVERSMFCHDITGCVLNLGKENTPR